MPKRSSKPVKKKPAKQKDTQQLARSILDAVAPEADMAEEKKKNPAAVMLGRLGGQKGGPARAQALSKKERSNIASLAAKARWKKANDNDNNSGA